MAKRRNSKMSKELSIAIGVGAILAIFLFGGRLTGMATSFNTDMDIVISSVEACTLTNAPTSIAAIGGTGGNYAPVGDGTMTNLGNAVSTFTQKGNVSAGVNSIFSAGSTVTFNAVSSSASAATTSDTTMTTTAATWCATVVTGESCVFDFTAVTTDAEAAATYEFKYTLACTF